MSFSKQHIETQQLILTVIYGTDIGINAIDGLILDQQCLRSHILNALISVETKNNN